MPSDSPPSPYTDRRSRQRTFWTKKYTEDPLFFGELESEFARWCLTLLREAGDFHDVVELGCGHGRDTRFLAGQGYDVRGVDLVGERAQAPAAVGASPGRFELISCDALDYLRELPGESVDAVYSNMFFNMEFTEDDHRELFGAVRRVLRTGGLHLYSARSTSDPWYGRGRKAAPDMFDPAPHGVTMHYFSTEYADRLASGLFTPVARRERTEGEGDFPIRLLYVADRRALAPNPHFG